MLIGLGPAHGIFLNACYYLPLVFWLFRAPRPRPRRADGDSPKIRGLADVANTVRPSSACRLYVALLEEVSPRDIRKLITRGKLLLELWSKNLVCRDFFEVSPDGARYEVIIGNLP